MVHEAGVQVNDWSVRRTYAAALRKAGSPVIRLAAHMGQSDNLNVGVMLPIDNEERKVSKWKASHRAPNAWSHNPSADARVFTHYSKDGLNVVPKTIRKLRLSRTVAAKLIKDLFLGELIKPDGLTHRPKISRSTRRRTSFQSVVTAVPASTAAQRLSISATHASSMSPSEGSAKLSRSLAAMSARSCSGS